MLAPMSLDALADFMSNMEPGSLSAHMAETELLRRQTEMQRDAANATTEAAEAAKETARFTRDNARYMLWSVIVLAASSVASLLVSIFK